MLTQNFRAIMLNRLSLAPYYEPTAISGSAFEWLIVERAGPMLMISDTRTPADGTETAPPTGLVPNNTLTGILIEEGASEETFIFIRHLPSPIETSGSFFPADGYVRISGDPTVNLSLEAHGRHALLTEMRKGQPIFVDMGLPSSNAPEARTWHFLAEQKL